MLSDNKLGTTEIKTQNRCFSSSSSVVLLISSLTRTVNQGVACHLQFGMSIAIKCHEVAKTIILRLICKNSVAKHSKHNAIVS